MEDDSPRAITEEEIIWTSKSDEDYKKALKYVRSNRNCDKPDLGQYSRVRDELEEHEGLHFAQNIAFSLLPNLMNPY